MIVAAALCFGTAAQAASSAASGELPLPLSGAAYRVAQEGYASFARLDYETGAAQAREAIRQRPDVVSLRLLLANSLAAAHHYEAAVVSLNDAIVEIGPDQALVSRRAQIKALSRSTNVGTQARSTRGKRKAVNVSAASVPGEANEKPLTGAAFAAAQRAYALYASKDFAGSAKAAGEAIALRPDVLRLRLLQIDAASNAGQDAVAFDADEDAAKRFGDTDALRSRRSFIGNRLAPKCSSDAFAALSQGDISQAVELIRQAIAYAPDRTGYRIQLIDALFAANDLSGVEAAASDGIAYGTANGRNDIMLWTLRGYARAAQGNVELADADFAKALQEKGATQRDQRVTRTIIADVWNNEGQPQRALDLLAPLKFVRDDTDPPLAARRFKAKQLLAAGASKASATTASIDPALRPDIACDTTEYGALCYVYPADPGFSAARNAVAATQRGDKKAAIEFERKAVAAAPDDPQHRVELINALTNDHQAAAAAREAKAVVRDGLLDGMPDLSAAYIAQRAGENGVAYQRFKQADQAGELPSRANADMAYTAAHAHQNKDAAMYFERAIDAGITPAEGDPAATPQQLLDMRNAHANVTRDWGFSVSTNYRSAGLQSGFASTPSPGIANNWQAGAEAYWRPFGSLDDRMFEVYTRGYESFGVRDGGPSGASTLENVIGARVKPFASSNTIFAIEHIFPIGSHVNNDWLARIAYSGGVGTERHIDKPSWWTEQMYAEGGCYLNAATCYATTNIEGGRTFRIDSISPKLTVFPYAVIGADYDSSIDHSIPVGAGVGVSTRYWMRDSAYDTPRSYVDLSVQYRWHITGDDRSRGLFFGAIYSY
ncbi:bacteriophage N4 adsorption protein A [Burkholderia sp. S171]|uniref:NfrA family protein n=1 Tax=Burkholderia sp. S171 TaxID=1641860 RepID=UPI0020B157A5|nr:bacteriophage N4 adsorption protein A [Burkholderia sp. S171]